MTNQIRQRIEHGFERAGHTIYHHPWKILLLVALLAAALLSRIPHLTIDTSTEGFLHKDDPTLIAYDSFREQFGRDELILITIKTRDVFDRVFLDKLNRFHRELEQNTPYLDDITSLINGRNTRGEQDTLIVEDLLDGWPLDDEVLQARRERALDNPLYKHMLLSEDGTITTVILRTDAYVSDVDDEDVLSGFDDLAISQDPSSATRTRLSDAQNSEVVNSVRSLVDTYHGDDFYIYYAGSPVVTDVLKRAMQSNMKRFTGLALLVIAIALFLMFRRISGVILPLLTVALSVVSTLGVMSILGIPITLPTQILPSFLLAVGIGASVHLLAVFFRKLHQLQDDETASQDEEVSPKEKAIAYALGHSGLAIIMTSLTTAAGLASFSGAEVAPISDLGQAASLGVLVALFYTLLLIPSLLAITPIKAKSGASSQRQHQRMDALMTRIADFSTDRSTLILVISAIVIIIGVSGMLQVKFSHKPWEWFPQDEPVRIATDFVNTNMRGAANAEVVIDTGARNGLYDPSVMKGLDTLGHEISKIDQGEIFVGKTLSLADILKETNRALNSNDPAFYTTPDNRELIAQELLLFENSGSDDLEDYVDSQFSKSRFTLKMPWIDSVLYPAFVADIEKRFHSVLGDAAEVQVTGLAVLLGRTMSAALESMRTSYLWAVIAITIMMILVIGNLRIGLVSMIPNLIPIILTLGLMGWFGLPLDLFTMLIGSISLGLAVDDTIHFMHNYNRYHHLSGDVRVAVRDTLKTTGRAIFYTTVVLSLGFFLYLFSDLSNLKNFGLLTGFTLIMAMLADFFLAPALMTKIHRARPSHP